MNIKKACTCPNRIDENGLIISKGNLVAECIECGGLCRVPTAESSPKQPWWMADKYWVRGETSRNEPDIPKIEEIVRDVEKIVMTINTKPFSQERREAWTMIFAALYPQAESFKRDMETELGCAARLADEAMEAWERRFRSEEKI